MEHYVLLHTPNVGYEEETHQGSIRRCAACLELMHQDRFIEASNHRRPLHDLLNDFKGAGIAIHRVER